MKIRETSSKSMEIMVLPIALKNNEKETSSNVNIGEVAVQLKDNNNETVSNKIQVMGVQLIDDDKEQNNTEKNVDDN